MARRAPLAVLALLAAASLAACAGSGGSGRAGPTPAPEPAGADAALAQAGGAQPAPRRPGAAPVEITWEALAVERAQAENPRFGRRPAQGAVPHQKIVLVNESHPRAAEARVGRTAVSQGNVTVAVVSDADMALLLQGFEQAGFFRHARDTNAMRALFEKPDARGRITVERGGRTLSIVSMRGQGTQAETKEIPLLYSQLKQTVAAVRNQTPTLNVVTAGSVGNARTR